MSTSVASALEIDIALQPKQETLLDLIENTSSRSFGFGGRRGGGKSGGIRRIMLIRRLTYGGTDGILLRRTRQELVDNHLVPLMREFPHMRDWWLERDKSLILPNGSRLLFRYAEHETDVQSLFGVEYADIAAEEAGLFTERELEKMKGSNRWPGTSPIKPVMIHSFMPGGRSHFYLKRIYVDRQYTGEEKAENFRFVEAFGRDNIEHCRKQLLRDGLSDYDYYYTLTEEQREAYFLASEYGQNLLSISDASLRAAWLEGDWGRFEGIVFPNFRDEFHNLDRFLSPGAFDKRSLEMRRVGAIDWADSGTTGAEECAIDTDENLYFFDEYGERSRTVSEHSAEVTSMFNRHGSQDYVLMDLPVNNINQANLFSIQDAFRRAGLNTLQAHRANIQIGLDLLNDYLRVDPNRVHPFTQELGSPRLFISRSRCPRLWKQMAELQREYDPETGKVKYIGEDDNLDPARYIAMSRPAAAERAKRLPDRLPVFHFEGKAQNALKKFDKTFGNEGSDNQWFPKADF